MKKVKRLMMLLMAFLMTATITPYNVQASPSQWAQSAVNTLVNKGAMIDSLNSEHQKPIQRDEFVAIFISATEASLGEIPISTTPFTDIDDTQYRDAIEKAYSVGLVGGTSDSTFSPMQLLTREQAAVLVTRPYEVLGYPTESADSFSDSNQISTWAKEGVSLAVDMGMMNGVGENNFSPKGFFTREQAFVVINNLFFSGAAELEPVKEPTPTEPEVREDLWLEVGGVRLWIGMTKDEVYSKLGQPQRTLMSEYGVPWHVYNSNYENFIMIGIDDGDDTVKAMLTTAKTFNTPYAKFGESNSQLFQSSTPYYNFYRHPTSRDYSMSDPLMAVLLKTISFSFDEITDEFLKDQEQVVFELLNGFRVGIGLNQLTWDEDAAEAIRLHCIDMIDNNYLAHTDSNGRGYATRYRDITTAGIASSENLGKGSAHTGLSIFLEWVYSYSHFLTFKDDYADGGGVSIVKNDTTFAFGLLLTRKN